MGWLDNIEPQASEDSQQPVQRGVGWLSRSAPPTPSVSIPAPPGPQTPPVDATGGFLSGVGEGIELGGEDLGDAFGGVGDILTGDVTPPEREPEAAVSFKDNFTSSENFGRFLGRLGTGSSPFMVGALTGGAAGSFLGPVGTGFGAIAGAAVGGGLAAGLQAMGQEYREALRGGKDADEAFTIAMGSGAASGVINGLSVVAGGKITKEVIAGGFKRWMTQLGTQEALGVADTVTQNVIADRPIGAGVPETLVGEAIFETPTVAAVAARASTDAAIRGVERARGRAEPQPRAVPETATESARPVDRQVFELSRTELEEAVAQATEDDFAAAVRAFGSEAEAMRYERLQRTANSAMDPARADDASAKIQEMESRLTEAQRNTLFGIGEPGISTEEASDVLSAVNRLVDTSSEESLADGLQFAITKLGRVAEGADLSSLSHAERRAAAVLRIAFEEGREAGLNMDQVANLAVQKAARRFGDPADAEFILDRFLRPRAQPDQRTTPALAPPGQGDISRAQPQAPGDVVPKSATRSAATVEGERPYQRVSRETIAKAKARILEISDNLDERGHQTLGRVVRKMSFGGLAGPELGRLQAEQQGLRQLEAAINSGKFDALGKKLKALPEETQRHAYEYLVGEQDGTNLPDAIRTEIADARQLIDAQTRFIRDVVLKTLRDVDESNLDAAQRNALAELQKVLTENMGEYVARFYKVHHVKGYVAHIKKTRPDLWAAVASEIRAKHPDLTEAGSFAMADALLKEHMYPFQHGSVASDLASAGIPRSRFIKRKNLTPAWRAFLGEVTDPRIVIEKTIHDQAAIIENFRFLKELAEYQDATTGARFAFDAPSTEAGAMIKVPVSLRNGSLSGKWVTREFYEALLDHSDSFFGQHTGVIVENIERYLSRPFRKAKVVYNPGTHWRNFLGNMSFAELANISLFNPRNWKYYGRALRALLDKTSRDFDRTARSGSLGAQYYRAPSVEKALRHIDLELRAGNSPLTALRKAAGAVDDFATQWYIAEDQLFRVASFLKQVENGKTDADAARWTAMFFPDYDNNPAALRQGEKLGVIRPFMSFFTQVPRIAANGLLHNPLKMGMLMIAAKAAQDGLLAAIDGEYTDEEQDEFNKLRTLMPEYAKAIVPLPKSFTGGKLKVVNIQNIFPFAELLQFSKEMADNPVRAATEQFAFGTPVAEGLLKMVTREDSRGYPARVSPWADDTRRLTRESGPGEFAKAAATHYLQSVTPPLTPGVGFEAQRVVKGITGKADIYGRKQSLLDATLGIATGMRPQEESWDVRHMQMNWRAIGTLRDLAKDARRAIETGVSPEEAAVHRQRILDAVKLYEAAEKEMDEALAAANRLGGTMTLPIKEKKALISGRKAVRTEVRNILRGLR